MAEEPMDVSGDTDKNASLFRYHNNSNSDMDVDTSVDRNHNSFMDFSFQGIQSALGSAAQFKTENKTSTPRIRSLVPSKETVQTSPVDKSEKIKHLQEEIKKLTEEKNRRKSRSKSKDLSPREKRISRRKSGQGKNTKGEKKVYILFFITVLFALFINFFMIHQKCHIHMDVRNFEQVFDDNVFGQHIAKYALTTTLRNISNRMQNDTKISTNPLVFSFHGWTGVGKNFVTKQLVYGFDNVRVTTFLVPMHFPHVSMDDVYKDQIQQWVKGNITLCYVNMFVFDEMDKATPGLLDGLLEVMKYIQTIEMQKTWVIFIFLSNSRGHQINNFLFTKMKEKKTRTDIEFDEILSVLTDIQTGSEWYHHFYEHDFIDTFVPFLPLNKQHVNQCIEKDLKLKGIRPTEELIAEISEEMHYIQPVKDMDLFSLTGCKRVSDKVDLHI